MGLLKRVQKTKTQKGKKALEEREPKAVENTKTALFVRGTNCSDTVMKCMKGEERHDLFLCQVNPNLNPQICPI